MTARIEDNNSFSWPFSAILNYQTKNKDSNPIIVCDMSGWLNKLQDKQAIYFICFSQN